MKFYSLSIHVYQRVADVVGISRTVIDFLNPRVSLWFRDAALISVNVICHYAAPLAHRCGLL